MSCQLLLVCFFFFFMSVFSQRTLWCHVCISNENLWFNTCIELSRTRQHPLCCCEAEVSCAWVCDPLWLYPHSRQQAHFNTFLRNTWHRPFVGPFTEHYKTINTNYHSAPSVAHYESNTTHLSFCSSHYNACEAWRLINLNSDRISAQAQTLHFWGGRLCSRAFDGSSLNALLPHVCITLPINKSDGTHVNARYFTLHTCKCTSGEAVIVQRGCCTKFAIRRPLENDVFIVLMTLVRELAHRLNC